LSYRGGPLARDERATPGRIQAGDRAPDAPGLDAAGQPLILFDVFRGPHFTLLALGASQVARAVWRNARFGPRVRVVGVVAPGDEVQGGDVFVDLHGHARAGYDLEGDALVLVRPDGYIGFITTDMSTVGVEDYLARVSGT